MLFLATISTRALPTMAPLAPAFKTVATWVGVEIPKPTQTGSLSASFRVLLTSVGRFLSRCLLVPVTPKREAR